jgi:ribosome-associated protein
MSEPLVIDGVLTIPGAELPWTSVRASGPGGQNVNKVASKVELRFDVQGSAVLPAPMKARLLALAASRLDAEGRIVVTSQLTRDRSQNLADARAKLAGLVRAAAHPPKRRRPTRPSFSAKRARLEGKRHQAKKKLMRHSKDD